ncbi:MAG: DUF4384 domain-containing protein [Stellaceae bacterium]
MIRTAGRIVAAIALALTLAGCGTGLGRDLNDAQAVIADLRLHKTPQPGGLAVAGTADRGAYRAGEPITLSVTANRAAYLSVLRVLRNGVTTIIFPSRTQPNPHIAANTPVTLRVTAADKGTELYEFIAAADGTAWPFTRKPPPGAEYVDLGSTTRALAGDLETTFGPAPPGTVAFAHLVLHVAP